jgi:hypothetical protein
MVMGSLVGDKGSKYCNLLNVKPIIFKLNQMKAQNIFKITGLWVCLMVPVMILTSCNEEEDLGTPRLFRPLAGVDNSIDNTLIVYWMGINDATSYHAEISRDSFLTIDQSKSVHADTTRVKFENLIGAQDYSIRVKAIHADPNLDSRYFVFNATTLTIFRNPSSAEILDFAFKARWDVRGDPVTRIEARLASNDSIVSVAYVAEEESSSGSKIVGNLTGNTQYAVYIFSEDNLRGKGTIRTAPSIEGKIVDLRSIDLRYDPETNIDFILFDTIANVEPESIILLRRGRNYEFSARKTLPSSVTVMSGYDFIPELAEITLNGNYFDFAQGSEVGEVVFRDVSVNSTFGGNSYFMYFNTVNVNKITFDNVRAKGMRGVFRITDNTVVKEVTFNNCVVDSIREFGITHISGINSYIENINVRNSTFNYVVRPFFNTSLSATSSNSLTVENCTFFHAVDNGRFFVDYIVPSTVIFRNCLFGETVQLLSGGTGHNGARVGAGGSLIVQNSLKTNDFGISATAVELAMYNSIELYNKSSYDIFTDPVIHNFKIKDSGFPSGIGDPRWK